MIQTKTTVRSRQIFVNFTAHRFIFRTKWKKQLNEENQLEAIINFTIEWFSSSKQLDNRKRYKIGEKELVGCTYISSFCFYLFERGIKMPYYCFKLNMNVNGIVDLISLKLIN